MPLLYITAPFLPAHFSGYSRGRYRPRIPPACFDSPISLYVFFRAGTYDRPRTTFALYPALRSGCLYEPVCSQI